MLKFVFFFLNEKVQWKKKIMIETYTYLDGEYKYYIPTYFVYYCQHFLSEMFWTNTQNSYWLMFLSIK